MIERTFSLALTLCVLVGGTLAVGSELFAVPAPAERAIAVLPTVVITGKRQQTDTAVARTEASDTGARLQ